MDDRRLNPAPWQATYLMLRPLAVQIAAAVRSRIDGRRVDVVDVGCGNRPYEPLFERVARSYVGIDLYPGEGIDLIGSAEALPVDAASFDVAICSQVLEHADDPQQVVAELSRVLRPGGIALASTHGTYRFHASPNDYWRWTHEGLRRLFEEHGMWSRIEVLPSGDIGSALAVVATGELVAIAEQYGVEPLSWPGVFALNLLGRNADRAIARVKPGRVPPLVANYLVIATR